MTEQKIAFNVTDTCEVKPSDMKNRGRSGKDQGERWVKLAEYAARERIAKDIPSDSQACEEIRKHLKINQEKYEQLLANANEKGINIPAFQRSMKEEGIIVYMYQDLFEYGKQQEISEWKQWLTDPDAQGKWAKFLNSKTQTPDGAYALASEHGLLENCNRERLQYKQQLQQTLQASAEILHQNPDTSSSHDMKLGLSSSEIVMRDKIVNDLRTNYYIIDDYNNFTTRRRNNNKEEEKIIKYERILRRLSILKEIVQKDVIDDEDKNKAIVQLYRIQKDDNTDRRNPAKEKVALLLVLNSIENREWEHLGQKIFKQLQHASFEGVENHPFNTGINWNDILPGEMKPNEQHNPAKSESFTWFTPSEGNDSTFERIDEAIKHDPNNMRKYADEALKHIDEDIFRDSKNVCFNIERGLVYIDKIIKHDPGNDFTYLSRAFNYLEYIIKHNSANVHETRSKALKLINDHIECNPNDILYCANKSFKFMHEAIDYNPGNVQYYINIAYYYSNTGIQLDPGNSKHYCKLLFDYLNKAKDPIQENINSYFNKASGLTDEAIKHNPNNAQLHYDELFNYIDEAMKRNPNNAQLYRNKLLEYINNSLERDPSLAKIYDNSQVLKDFFAR